VLNYIRQIVFLAVPVPIIPSDAVGLAYVAATVGIAVVIAFFVARRGRAGERERRVASFGAAWCLLMSAPFAVGSHPRELYQVSFGLAVVLAAALGFIGRQTDVARAMKGVAVTAFGAYLAMNVVIVGRIQEKFAPHSGSTLATYLAERTANQFDGRPDGAFEADLRSHVNEHLSRHGCAGETVPRRCLGEVTYDLNRLLPHYGLGVALHKRLAAR
jgi:hypothetical protein